MIGKVATLISIATACVLIGWWAAATDKDVKDAKTSQGTLIEIVERLEGYHTAQQVRERERARIKACLAKGIKIEDCPDGPP
jgi:hypothetical protein